MTTFVSKPGTWHTASFPKSKSIKLARESTPKSMCCLVIQKHDPGQKPTLKGSQGMNLAFHMDLHWLPKNSAHWKTCQPARAYSAVGHSGHMASAPQDDCLCTSLKNKLRQHHPRASHVKTGKHWTMNWSWQAPLFLFFICLATRTGSIPKVQCSFQGL